MHVECHRVCQFTSVVPPPIDQLVGFGHFNLWKHWIQVRLPHQPVTELI